MKILAISDIHGSLQPIEAGAKLIREADLIVIAGDITRGGTAEEARQILSHISQYNSNIIAVHGNWDRSEVRDLLKEWGYGIHATGREIDGIGFFGVGGSNPTPINTPSDYSEEELSDFLSRGYETVKHTERIILISHAPPRGARDRMFLGMRVGSKSVGEFLSQNRVDLCICGHIHEAHGQEQMHDTLVLNTGSFISGRYAIVDITDSIAIKLERIQKAKLKN
jgi:Icc-related predicted phosphoesterase